MKIRKDFKYVEFPGVGVVLFEKSKRAKMVSIVVKSSDKVRVVVPRYISIKRAESYVSQKLDWIKKKQFNIRNKTNVLELVSEVSLEEKENLIKRVNDLSGQYGFKHNKITLRKMKTRWGSCTYKNNISLNIGLVRLPEKYKDYVILHELVHTKIKNHSNEFWTELERTIEEPKVLSRELHQKFSLIEG